MGNAEDKAVSVNKPEETFGGLIIITALKTLKWILIVVALAATLFCCLFPYNAMDVYRRLGMYDKALDCCDICIKEAKTANDLDEYSAHLSTGIIISEMLLGETTDTPYDSANMRKLTARAERTHGYTREYLELDSAVRSTRSTEIDNANIQNAARAIHPIVYGFENFVRATDIYAGLLCGDTSYNSVISTFASAISGDGSPTTKITALSDANAYFRFEFYRIGYGGDTAKAPHIGGGMTTLLNSAMTDISVDTSKILDKFQGLVKDTITDTGLSALKILYSLRQLAIMADNLTDGLRLAASDNNVSLAAQIERAEKLKTIPDTQITIWNLYVNLSGIYTKN